MGTVYFLKNGMAFLFLPVEVRKKAKLKDGDKVMFGAVKTTKEVYFIKSDYSMGRMSRKVNMTNTNGTLISIPKIIVELMELKHKDKIEFDIKKRVYIKKK